MLKATLLPDFLNPCFSNLKLSDFSNHFWFPDSLLCFLSLFRLLCRLTYALCLNFLAVIHLDGHVTGAVEKVETSFTKVKIFFIISFLVSSVINIILGI